MARARTKHEVAPAMSAESPTIAVAGHCGQLTGSPAPALATGTCRWCQSPSSFPPGPWLCPRTAYPRVSERPSQTLLSGRPFTSFSALNTGCSSL